MSLSGNIYTFSTNKLTQSYNERTLHLAVTMLYIHRKTNTIIHSCFIILYIVTCSWLDYFI